MKKISYIKIEKRDGNKAKIFLLKDEKRYLKKKDIIERKEKLSKGEAVHNIV